MSTDSGSGSLKSFIVVLLGLVAFTYVMMTLGRSMSPIVGHNETLLKQSVVERLAPVGSIRTAASAADEGAAAPVADVAVAKSPRELYDAVCGACHNTGVAGAPLLSDKDEWAKRGSVGIDALVASAIAGKGAMPPRGGSSYSEEQLKSIVELYLAQ